MSVSHLSLLEQPRGTGPPGDQTASECQPGVWVLPPSPTNNSGLRSGAHDPERPGEVVAQRGCGWPGLVHQRDARVAGLNNSRAPLNRLGSISQPFLQHFHPDSLPPRRTTARCEMRMPSTLGSPMARVQPAPDGTRERLLVHGRGYTAGRTVPEHVGEHVTSARRRRSLRLPRYLAWAWQRPRFPRTPYSSDS